MPSREALVPRKPTPRAAVVERAVSVGVVSEAVSGGEPGRFRQSCDEGLGDGGIIAGHTQLAAVVVVGRTVEHRGDPRRRQLRAGLGKRRGGFGQRRGGADVVDLMARHAAELPHAPRKIVDGRRTDIGMLAEGGDEGVEGAAFVVLEGVRGNARRRLGKAALIGRQPAEFRRGVLIRGGCLAVERVARETTGGLDDGAAAIRVAFFGGLFKSRVPRSREQGGEVVGFFVG